jgi:hypothetical protein
VYAIMPNLDPWINHQQNEEEFTTPCKFENHLLSIKDERQKMVRPNCHPTYIMNVSSKNYRNDRLDFGKI